MGNVIDDVAEMLSNPELREAIDNNPEIAETLAPIQGFIDLQHTAIIEAIIVAAQNSDYVAMKLIATLRQYPILMLELLFYLNEKPKPKKGAPKITLLKVARSYACIIKSHIDEESYTNTFNDHIGGDYLKRLIKPSTSKEETTQAIKALQFLALLDEDAIKTACREFKLDLSLIK